MTEKTARTKSKKVEKRSHLTKEEMLMIDSFGKDVGLLNKDIAIKRKEIEILEIKRQLLGKDIDILGHNVLEIQAKISKISNKSSEYIKSLVKELDVKTSKFGYNPDTGEVIED